MAIDPATTTTVKVGELASAGFNASDLVPHEVAGLLKKGTLGDLATFIGGQISATSGVGFRAVQVLDGQTLPATTEQEFILVGPGTFPNVGGGASITTTEELNALVSNGTYWFIGVEIPINAADGAFEPAITTGTTAQYWRGDKTWQDLNKATVGLGNVDNTTDSGKPISTATQTALDLKANDSAVVKLTGDQTVAGIKTFSSFLKSGLLFINEAGGFGSITGYTQLGGTADYFQVINGTNTKSTKFIHNGARNLTMPGTDGTLALTSQIPTVSGTTNYLPKFTGASSLGNSVVSETAYGIKVQGSAGGDTLVLDKLSGASVAFNVNGVYTGQIGAVANDLYVGSKSVYPAMVIKDAGNVGIGTTAPDNGKLTILKNSSYATESSYGIAIQSNTSNVYTELLLGADDTVDCGVIQSASKNTSFTTRKLAINPNGGNVGIGTTSPLTALQVDSLNKVTDSVGNIFISTSDSLSADIGGQLTLGGLWNGSSKYAFAGIAGRKENSTSGNVAGYLSLLTTTSGGAVTERMRITSGGNVGIATTAPTEKLEVSGNVKATSFIKSGGTSSQFLMADGSVSTGSSGYKVYVALIGQTGTNAPTVTVLENTIGSIVWSYVTPGVYFGTLSNAFTAAKTTCEISTVSNMSNVNFSLQRNNNANQVFLQTLSSGTATNGLLGALNDNSTKIEIRVYN